MATGREPEPTPNAVFYGPGSTSISSRPFSQIENDSDRAVGIVAGAIVERRLEDAIKSRMRVDHPNILTELFRPSGPLGSLSAKIQLAFVIRIVSDVAYKDLMNMKGIRNDFAHELEINSFDIPSVRDRCANFILLEKHTGPNTGGIPEGKAIPYYGFSDYEKIFRDPRVRYVATTQVLSYLLGQGAINPDRALPFV